MLLEQMGERVREVLSSQLLILNSWIPGPGLPSSLLWCPPSNLQHWVVLPTLGLPLVHSDLHTQKSAQMYVFLHCKYLSIANIL